jgi:hypothetical protein
MYLAGESPVGYAPPILGVEIFSLHSSSNITILWQLAAGCAGRSMRRDGSSEQGGRRRPHSPAAFSWLQPFEEGSSHVMFQLLAPPV